MSATKELPRVRRWVVAGGTLLALCVYYLNYGTTFHEGEIQGGSSITLLARAVAVAAIVLALSPLRLYRGSALMCVGLYLLSATSLFLAAASHGGLNDTFFINTLLQLPVLLVVTGTRWRVDHAWWLRWLCCLLALQVLVDTVVWQAGASLWLSLAFIGGVGNPSSFGLLCTVGLAFCLFHPQAGRWRWLLAFTLAFGAVMTKALFAVLAVALLAAVWMAMGWRRALAGLVVGIIGTLTVVTLLIGGESESDLGFVGHKLSAAFALVGLMEYDLESSASVSLRVEMHEQTLNAIADAPQRLFWGHLDGLPYWAMDSQLLTYLGSFGALMLAAFLALHFGWTWRAWGQRRRDGGFALVSLLLFALIFTTNRVLDYYPVATLYFLIIATVLRPGGLSFDEKASTTAQSIGGKIVLPNPR
jgi:hypothetical protein